MKQFKTVMVKNNKQEINIFLVLTSVIWLSWAGLPIP